MASINKVTLIENLGQDPETRHMPRSASRILLEITGARVKADKAAQQNEWGDWI